MKNKELNITVREDTLKQMIASYIKDLDDTIDKDRVYPNSWIKTHISKHVEIFDLIETHNLILNPTLDKVMHRNLNFLRAQIYMEINDINDV